ncbi:Uncharacterized protein BP5553_01847 [Venustampulla echinocandica]|uniref:Integral membrane protein n=1 Tax=Venustampulla echinocandica TaxID=2656787 RepID=A0A370U268_9HELO|nr:Uncharacterized protein BP5553_01847 [Venustampulla echinocandica]RDL41868.1 Uncharacterized protein BP5553_01847 [Venustampulla echinocandica]
MATPAVPVYFEQSWAILSSIGLVNVILGFMVVGITSLSPISLVPIVVSAAGAVANGLCYYAFYADYPTTPTVVAAAVADIGWLIQEAGLSFYSYLILIRVLRRRDRLIFMSLFWSMMAILTGLRIAILVNRSKQIIDDTLNLQGLIDHLHVGFFSSIAVVEIISSVFLLRKFAAAKRTSMEAASRSGLFKYLMRSTEVRLATLALIGITRAITYSFQEAAQSATSVASQVDRFVFTLECLFPVIMFIDILASKLVVANHIHESSSNRAYPKSSAGRQTGTGGRDIALYSMNHIETRVDAGAPPSSSQERIVEGHARKSDTPSGRESSEIDRKNGGINKTVEFEFHESAV